MADIWDMPRKFAYMADGTCKLQRRSLMSNNPFNAYRRVVGPIDERWVIRMTMPTLGNDDWRDWEGFLSLLDGMANYIRMPDPACLYPFGEGTGSNPNNDPTGVNQSQNAWSDATTWDDGTKWYDSSPSLSIQAAATAGAEWIHIGDLKASQTEALKRGDKMEIGGLLYQIVSEIVPSDASGEALVKIRPRLRAAVAAEDPIVLYYPTSVFQLLTDDDGVVERQEPHFGDVGMTLIEVPEAVLSP